MKRQRDDVDKIIKKDLLRYLSTTMSLTMNNRIEQLDFLKCVFIIHVIMIHLVSLGHDFPWLKEFFLLYTTPVFFVISGFLAHVDKPAPVFFHKVLWWFIPYAIMESGYIAMATLLPINEHITQLTPSIFLSKLFLTPLGPYWYIHNLIISYVVYYGAHYLYRAYARWAGILLGAVAIFVFVFWLGIVSLHCLLFFCLGIVIKHSKIPFLTIFRPNLVWLLAAIVLAFAYQHLPYHDVFCGLLTSVWLSYVMTTLWLLIERCLPQAVRLVSFVIGKNTLAILLFSPAFTIVTKRFVPFLAFDPTDILFTLVSVAFTVGGCLLTAKAMDLLGISPYFCGKPRFYCRK